MDIFGGYDEGDFDQYSIAGVDFGENYDAIYGIEPVNLQGESKMYGSYYDQLSGDESMGNVLFKPEMGGYYNQMSGYHQQLGEYNKQLGVTPNYTIGGMVDDLKMKFNMMGTTSKVMLLGGIVLGAAFGLRKMGVIKKKLPIIG